MVWHAARINCIKLVKLDNFDRLFIAAILSCHWDNQATFTALPETLQPCEILTAFLWCQSCSRFCLRSSNSTVLIWLAIACSDKANQNSLLIKVSHAWFAHPHSFVRNNKIHFSFWPRRISYSLMSFLMMSMALREARPKKLNWLSYWDCKQSSHERADLDCHNSSADSGGLCKIQSYCKSELHLKICPCHSSWEILESKLEKKMNAWHKTAVCFFGVVHKCIGVVSIYANFPNHNWGQERKDHQT